MKLNNKGFSFVELLAAVAILAILSSFAIVGVSSILDKSHKEYYNNERKNLVLAAQAYMNENKSELPKVVGKKVRVEANKLKEANYLKKDIRTYNNKGSCMDSFVNVFKYGQSDYSYTAYLDCEGEDKDAYKDPANVSPTFAVNWPTNNKDVALSYVKITVNGGDEDNPINLLSYSYTISIYNESKEKFEDIINSGIKIYRAPSITKAVSLAKYTIKGNARMRVKMTATNINGVSKSQVFLRNFKDDVAPNCIIKPEDTINTPEGKKPWVNDKRTITIGCDDGDGSGCEKKSYTKTFTADNIEDYITIKDNAGESKKCYVTTYIDKTKPKIVATAYKCKPGSTTADTNQKVAEITATTDTNWSSSNFLDNVNGWLNKDNYPDGVCFVFEVEDNLALGNKTWKWNTANLAKNASGYKNLNGGTSSDLGINTGQYITNKYVSKKTYTHSLTAEGHRYAEFNIKDDYGNSTTLKMDIKIDRTAPNKPSNNMKKWSNNSTKPDTLAKGQALVTGYSNDTWTLLKVFTWPGAVTDSISGGVYYEYTTTGATENNEDHKATFRNVAAQGVSYIKWRSFDEAGNTLGYNDQRTLKLDWTKPEINIKPYKRTDSGGKSGSARADITANDSSGNKTLNSSDITGHNNGWFNKDFPDGLYYAVSITDNVSLASEKWEWNTSGIRDGASGYRTLNGGSSTDTLSTVTGNFTTSKSYNHSLSAAGYRYGRLTATDAAGNTIYINIETKMDRTNPDCSLGNYGNQCETGGVSATVTCTDAMSGVNKCAGDDKSSPTSATSNKTGRKETKTYHVYDTAGNSNTCDFVVYSDTQYAIRTCKNCEECSAAGCKTPHYTTVTDHYISYAEKGCKSGYWTTSLSTCNIDSGNTSSICCYTSSTYVDGCDAYNTSCADCGCEGWNDFGGYSVNNSCAGYGKNKCDRTSRVVYRHKTSSCG